MFIFLMQRCRFELFDLDVAQLKKFLIFNVNGVFCYFPKCAHFEGDQQKIGKNLNMSKLEIHAKV